MEDEEIMQEGESSRNYSDDDDAEAEEEEITPKSSTLNPYDHGSADYDLDAVRSPHDMVVDVDSLVGFMKGKVDSTRGKPSYRFTIFRIPKELHSNADDNAYSPKVVSIGLLQQRELRLDEIKWHYLDKVLSRSTNDLETYTKEMENIVVEAASCYSPEPGGLLDLLLIDYVEIMLVDGCFLINLFLQLEDRWVDKNDPIYRTDRWTLPWVGHDMLLLENQLPFFVLEKLWELTGRERPALKREVLRFFRNLLPEEHDLKLPETEDVHHLLHLIHLSLQPASSSKKPESTSGITIPRPPQPGDTLFSTKNSSFKSPESLQPTSHTEKPESVSGATIPSPPQPSDTLCTLKSFPFKSTEFHKRTARARKKWRWPQPKANFLPHDGFSIRSSPEQIPRGIEQIPRAQQIKQMSEPRPPPPPKTIPSATELQQAGVKLRKKMARSFLDVTFEQGLMQIPRLTISDTTNSLFRNFIAFEQGFPDCGDHFTSYCIFMDSLINTPRDVAILKQAGIIEHVLGSDEEVAFLFNKLCRGITWDFKNSYLAKVFEDVNHHTQKRCPKWRAILMRDYFSNPWAILSLIAAIVILILTFLQAYFGVFGYFRPPKT